MVPCLQAVSILSSGRHNGFTRVLPGPGRVMRLRRVFGGVRGRANSASGVTGVSSFEAYKRQLAGVIT